MREDEWQYTTTVDNVDQVKFPRDARKLRSLKATNGVARTAARAYILGVRVSDAIRPVALRAVRHLVGHRKE